MVSTTVSALVRIKLRKSEEFLTVAEIAVSSELYNVAASLAAISAVNSSDALCLLAIGRFSEGGAHADAVRLLKLAGLEIESTHLGRALSTKSKAQYSGRLCTLHDAESATKHATRLDERARELARSKGETIE